MMHTTRALRYFQSLLIVALLALTTTVVTAADDEPQAQEEPAAKPQGLTEQVETGTKDGPKSLREQSPIAFSIEYTLVSDYIFRGINFSTYPGEGREKPNHQLGINFELDTSKIFDGKKDLGTFGGTVWFEWFAGQKNITPDYGSDLQEVDYTAYWRYNIAPLATTTEFGWTYYQFPPYSGDASNTKEFYVQLSFDDSKLFGTENPVLNPYVFYALDYDQADCGSWIELGVSHDFALGEIKGLEEAPILKDLTLTPSLTLGIDHRYLNNFAFGSDGYAASAGTHLANLLYGFDVSYDLSSALGLPTDVGDITVGGFLYYSQALRTELLNNEFYGGMTVGYAW